MPTIQSAGVPISYELVGDGTPLVLVHPFAMSFEVWRQIGWLDFLVDQGRRVVGVDCRGHGRSGKPLDSRAYDGYQLADDVLAVMDAVGLERADIMGYSMGGRIAVNLLARFPERFSVVIAGGAGLRPQRRDPHTQTAIAAAMEADDLSSVSNPVALFMRQFAERNGNDLHALAAMVRSNDRLVYDPPEIVAALSRAHVPVLAVVGDQDPVLAEAQLLIETVPQGELLVLPGLDHGTTGESPTFKDAVASFLELHAATAA
jgi:pimeloyl-ACP methyl ester carboxylesterase